MSNPLPKNMSNSANQKPETYILAVGERGHPRLDTMHEVIGADSRRHVLEAGLRRGMRVADIGCGPGKMALWIAEEVTDRGAVWAVDASAQQLAIARGQAEARNFTWIRFVESEIDRLDLVPNDLDFVYVRCLLMHLRDPLGALERMKSCLQRGGTLAIQEPISSTAYSIPTQPVFEKLNRTLAAIALAKGVDFDVGRSLPELVHKAGFRDVKLYYTQRAVDMATMKRLLILGIQESASAAMGTGAATQAELTAWVNEVSGMDESPDRYYVLPSQAHITARVP